MCSKKPLQRPISENEKITVLEYQFSAQVALYKDFRVCKIDLFVISSCCPLPISTTGVVGSFISLSLLTVQSFCPSGLFLGGRCSRPFPLLAGLAPWPVPHCENVGRLPVLVWLSTLSVLFVFLFRNDWNRGPFFILFHWLFPWPETKSKIEQHSTAKSKALILEILLVWQRNRKYRMNGDPWLYTGLRPKGWSIMTTNNFVIVCDSWRYEQKHDSYVSSLPLMMVEYVGVEPPWGRVEVTNLLKQMLENGGCILLLFPTKWMRWIA